jgi:hypothetical protein
MSREFKIPGKLFAKTVENLRLELLRILDSPSEGFPVRKIFDFISLTDSNQEVERKLIARGIFTRENGEIYRNQTALPLSERIRDIGPDLEGLRLYIPRVVDLNFSYQVSEDLLTITPVQKSRRVLIEFDTAPVPGFGISFVLESIEADSAGWRYKFHEEFDASNRVDIYVEMTLEASVYAGRRSNFPSLDRPVLLGREVTEGVRAAKSFGQAISSCACDCCNLPCDPTRRSICPPDNVMLALTIRLVIVVTTAADAPAIEKRYERWLKATQKLFKHASNLRIVDGGTEVVVDPAFVDIDPSPCNCRQRSKDTIALYNKYYGEPQDSTVVAFVLRSLSGDTVGCAAHPIGRPGFTMEYFSPTWVHAHELGHVLGLRHVNNQDNLMWEKTNITNPPPDLNSDQISDIRCSLYVRQERSA